MPRGLSTRPKARNSNRGWHRQRARAQSARPIWRFRFHSTVHQLPASKTTASKYHLSDYLGTIIHSINHGPASSLSRQTTPPILKFTAAAPLSPENRRPASLPRWGRWPTSMISSSISVRRLNHTLGSSVGDSASVSTTPSGGLTAAANIAAVCLPLSCRCGISKEA